MTFNDLARLLRPYSVKIANLVGRGVVRAVDDSTKLQELQIELLADEVRGEIEHFQPFGLAGAPDVDAEAVVVFVGGRREHGLAVAVADRRYRPTGLQPGEVVVYDKSGSRIVLKANGDIELVPHSGNVKVTGTLTATVDVVAAGKHLATHTHPAGGTLIDTGVPGGLVTGSTGAPT